MNSLFSKRLLVLATLVALAASLHAQTSGSVSNGSSSSSTNTHHDESLETHAAAAHTVEAAGSAITLETNEALFTVAAALNACGYNTDLEHSLPVRAAIRKDIEDSIAQSPQAADARRALCDYVVDHQLSGALNLAQYVSLALYTTPPPELELSVPETEMPPDATPVDNILPLLRTFSETTHLHVIWIAHRAEYEAAISQVHDVLTRTVLGANVYLHMPVSTYEGRRFLILLEPLLSPAATNARVYGADYFVVVSPTPLAADADRRTAAGVHMDEIRHAYLHYTVDPLVYARAAATDRLLPLLKTIEDSPVDYANKTDIVSFVTECLIKAIEARTSDVGFPRPHRPINPRERTEIDQYNLDVVDYNRKAEIVRQNLVDHDMHQGWVLTDYFYAELIPMESNGVSLRDNIGEMVYGMDVPHQVGVARNVVFDKVSDGDILRHQRATHTQLSPLELGEMKLYKNDLPGAEAIGKQLLEKNPHDGRALYLLARVDLMHRDPESAVDKFHQVVTLAPDPQTLAWAHIYLGRLYDTLPDRDAALNEYRAALSIREAQPDARAAAEDGMKKPFTTHQAAAPAKQNTDAMPPRQ